jgi:hypothetical protein
MCNCVMFFATECKKVTVLEAPHPLVSRDQVLWRTTQSAGPYDVMALRDYQSAIGEIIIKCSVTLERISFAPLAAKRRSLNFINDHFPRDAWQVSVLCDGRQFILL